MIQPSALNFVIMLAMLLIAGFLLRSVAARYADKPIGQAIAYVY